MKNKRKNLLDSIAALFALTIPEPEVVIRERTLTQRIAVLEHQNKTTGLFITDLHKTNDVAAQRAQRIAVRIEQVQTNNNTLVREIEELQVYTHKLSQYVLFLGAVSALTVGILAAALCLRLFQ